MRHQCPKCSRQSAWIEKSIHDLTLRCLCGYHKVVFSKLETVVPVVQTRDVRLPKSDTNLWFTVMVLWVLERATSAEITERLVDLGKAFTVSDVSSYLTILRGKGLVETVELRRRMAGGSTWEISTEAQELIAA
jgi:hypothetical protein